MRGAHAATAGTRSAPTGGAPTTATRRGGATTRVVPSGETVRAVPPGDVVMRGAPAAGTDTPCVPTAGPSATTVRRGGATTRVVPPGETVRAVPPGDVVMHGAPAAGTVARRLPTGAAFGEAMARAVPLGEMTRVVPLGEVAMRVAWAPGSKAQYVSVCGGVTGITLAGDVNARATLRLAGAMGAAVAREVGAVLAATLVAAGAMGAAVAREVRAVLAVVHGTPGRNVTGPGKSPAQVTHLLPRRMQRWQVRAPHELQPLHARAHAGHVAPNDLQAKTPHLGTSTDSCVQKTTRQPRHRTGAQDAPARWHT